MKDLLKAISEKQFQRNRCPQACQPSCLTSWPDRDESCDLQTDSRHTDKALDLLLGAGVEYT